VARQTDGWQIVAEGLVPALLENRPSASELASRSWKSLRQAFRAMPFIYVGMFLVYGAITLGPYPIAKYTAVGHYHPPVPMTAFLISVSLLQTVVSLAAIAVAAVATHRFILLDDIRPRIGRNSLDFFLWLVFITIIIALLDVAKILDRRAMPDSGLTDMVGGVIWIAKIAIIFHFALLFPAVAIGEKAEGWQDRISISWSRMSGNFWLFFAADLAALLPFIFAITVSILLVTLPLSDWNRGSVALASVEIFRGLVPFPVLMVQAAIASWLYAWVRQQPDADLEPASATPG
jgi:hypothetical protein